MDSQDLARIGAYLLRRLPARERAEFESRILEVPALLDSVKRAEAAILRGDFAAQPKVARPCVGCFVLGFVAGALLASVTLLAL